MILQKPLYSLFSSLVLCICSVYVQAQVPISTTENQMLHHGREQFQQGHYALSIASLEQYLQEESLPTQKIATQVATANREEAQYLVTISKIKLQDPAILLPAESFIASTTNPVYQQRTAFALAQYYFQKNELDKAISFYEKAGIDNLSNKEIGDEKFELGYSYFNQKQFEKAKPLFATIKELPDGKYYNAGNYYYGLLAYNDGDYDNALRSFDRIDNVADYKDVVPYYRAEIHYFKGDYEKVLHISNRYLNKKEKLYYDKELHLLTAQTYFEQKKYREALPFFEYYYTNSEKVRKEELYEMAYTYYQLSQWKNAIEKFKQLSNTQDSLGQTSMYLLGDCYLKTDDKKSARNAFGICVDMNFNTVQQENSAFLYAKLSYELGHETIATRAFDAFIKQYPKSQFVNESRVLLAGLLSRSSNFAEAFDIISDMPAKDNDTWNLYQKVAVSRAIQLLQENNLKSADSVFNLSLQQPVNTELEAITYFWKSEIAYLEKRFSQTIQFANTFLSKSKNYPESIKSISPQATSQNAQMNIGFAQMEEGNYELAKQAFAAAQSSGSQYNNTTTSEATLREADAAFMLKDFDRALSLYDKSIAGGVADADYALFQKALILGLQNKDAEKINTLNQIINKQPTSIQKSNAEYELSITYLELDKHQEAIALLKKLIADELINENIRSKAQLKLAYAYQDAGDNNKAIENYKTYITQYTSMPDRAAAVDALRNIYINMGQPQLFDAFVKENNLPDVDATTMENTYYMSAENEYANNNYDKAIESLQSYLKTFPAGNSRLKANYYIAESYYQLGKKQEALPYYEKVFDEGWNDFSESAAERAAEIALENKEYQHARDYYGALRNNAMQNDNLIKAYRGLMITSYNLDAFDVAVSYADTLMTLQNSNEIDEANLYKAKSLIHMRDYDEASIILKNLEKKNNDVLSAEARYYIAYTLLKQNKLKDAEDYASYSMQASSGNEYWMVKNYILMGDILTAEKDYFNAKATLQSVIKNTKDSTLKNEAEQKLQEVKELEKQQSKLSEE